jgi:serine/threonine protein kinase
MVTGSLPFPGSTSAVIFGNILHTAPVSPVHLNDTVPAELERILNKLLEKDRDLRYQVAAEVRTDLKRLQRRGHGQQRIDLRRTFRLRPRGRENAFRSRSAFQQHRGTRRSGPQKQNRRYRHAHRHAGRPGRRRVWALFVGA